MGNSFGSPCPFEISIDLEECLDEVMKYIDREIRMGEFEVLRLQYTLTTPQLAIYLESYC